MDAALKCRADGTPERLFPIILPKCRSYGTKKSLIIKYLALNLMTLPYGTKSCYRIKIQNKSSNPTF
jgi:hypothetical protein